MLVRLQQGTPSNDRAVAARLANESKPAFVAGFVVPGLRKGPLTLFEKGPGEAPLAPRFEAFSRAAGASH